MKVTRWRQFAAFACVSRNIAY